MQLNKEFFKRESTWFNIIEAVGVVLVGFMMDVPETMTPYLWGALGLRVLMSITQGLKRSL